MAGETSKPYRHVQIARRHRVHISQSQIPTEIAAELPLILFLHDGELLQDVSGVLTVETVKMKEQRIQSGQSMTPVFFIPDKWLAAITHVLGKGFHVHGGVAEVENLFPDEVGDFVSTDSLLEVLCRNNGELFDDKQV